MTPQEVIEKFMAELTVNDYSYYTSGVGTKMLDDAVKASSKFTSTQTVINQMLADQTEAEKLAVEEVLGSTYAGKTMSQVSSSILSAAAKNYDTANKGNGYYNQWNDNRTTVERLINERKALIFLEKYCGIVLENNFYVARDDEGKDVITSWAGSTTGNVDTGAITGSDANITLKAGDVVNGTTLTAAYLKTLATKYGSAAKLSGDTLVIGTGVEKTETSIVPEEGDMYLFKASGTAKNINTGSNGWVVNATSGNDVITSGGRDSVNTGAGNDSIKIGADEATVTTGNGSDTVEVAANVNSVTVTDLNSSDTIKISGTFEVGNAKIENSMLVVTDKTGTRKIRFNDLANAAQAKIGAQTISQWLANAGYNVNSLSNGDAANTDTATVVEIPADGRVAIDSDYKPTPLDIANEDIGDQTQTVSSTTNINLDDVTITSGTVKSGSSTVGTVSTVTPAVTNFTVRGLTVHVGDGTASSYNQLTAGQKTMVAALFKWWADECLKINEDSYDFGFTSDTAKITDITLSFESLSGNILAQVAPHQNPYTGQLAALELQINTAYYNDFPENDKDGLSSLTAALLDRTLAHEFTHAVMMSNNTKNFYSLPQFIIEGMAELTHGIDDERGNVIFELGYDANRLATALNVVSYTSPGQADGYAGGYMFLRYFAKQAALQTLDFTDIEPDDNPSVPSGIFTEGNDTYNNTVDAVALLALGGDDSVTNSGASVTIDGMGGNDYVYNNHGASVSINGGEGNDFIINWGDNVTIDGDEGDDLIYNHAESNVTISSGAGDDKIYSNGNNVTIDGGDGDDSIGSYADSVSIDGGAGDDSIDTSGSNVSISGGKGNDTIFASNREKSLIEYTSGDGNDLILGFNATSTLKIGGGTGTYSTTKSGNNLFVCVGNDTITLVGAASLAGNIQGDIRTYTPVPHASNKITLTANADTYINSIEGATILALDGDDNLLNAFMNVSIDAGAGNDSVTNFNDSVTISGDAGDDSIINRNDSVSIDGMGGNDFIINTGSTVTINGGASDDTIGNNGSTVTIDGGAGDDSIDNGQYGDSVSINAGAGDDTISNGGSDSVSISGGDGDDSIDNWGDNVTIDASLGNDQISLHSYAEKTLIEYADGDGKDTVEGFDGNDTLKIGNGTTDTYSKATVDNDIIITVGDGSILLKDAATLSTVNIAGTETVAVNPSVPSGIFTEGNDTYNNTVDNVALLALGGDDSVTNSGSNVSIDGGAGDDYIYNNGEYYNTSIGSNVTIDGGLGNDSIVNNGTNVTIDGGAGDDKIENSYFGSGGDSVSIDGGLGNDSIENYGSSVSIDGGLGNDFIANSGGDSVTITGGTGNDTITLSSGAKNNLIQYTSGDGNDFIVGFNADDTLQIGGGTGTYSTTKSGDNLFVCVGNDTITLIDAASLAGNIQGDLRTYTPATPASKNIKLTEGADIGINSIEGATIQALGGNDNLLNAFTNVSIDAGTGNDTVTNYNDSVTVNGGTGNDSIYNSKFGNSVTISGGVGNDTIKNYGAKVAIDGGDGDDAISNRGSNVFIDGGDGDDTISNDGNDFNLGVIIDGGNGNDRIYNQDGVYVSIDGGDGNDYIENSAGYEFTIAGGTGNDTITLSYYSARETVIKYASGDGNDTVWYFDGDDTLKIGNGTTDTYSKATVDNDIIITVGDGSILLKDAATLDTVNISGEEGTPADNWTFNNGVAKYKNLFTLSGINPNLTVDELDAAIEIDGNKIILSANALGKSDVTLTTTGNYSLALGDDCPTVTATEKGWTLDGTTATYHDAGKSDGYKLTDAKTITYTAATVGKALLTVSGVVEGVSEDDLNENLTVSGKVLTVTPDVVGNNFSVDAGYKVVFSEGDYAGSTFTGTDGKDTIEVNGSGLQLSLGAGNDTVTSNGDGGNTYMFDANGGKDVVKGYNSDDVIKITDSSSVTTSVKGSDIIVKAGSATMTLKNAATGTHLNVVDSADKTLIDETVYADRIVVDDGATLLSAFNATNFTAEDPIVKVDASVVTKRFSLTGGDADNTLIGGTGSNFINGGDGSNELTGGRGNDTFVAGNGVDTITDYGVGTDKISLTADVSGFEVKGDDVIIGFDDDKSVTIADGAGKKIYFLQNGRSSTEIFGAGGKMNTAKTSITLNASTDNYTAASTIITINGSLTEGVNIVGNAKANKIFGSDYDDTLNGGTKNATITGGNGSDIFVYETGKIVISDYVSGDDRISLGASPTAESLKSNGDVFLKFGSDSLTIKKVGDTSNGRTITFTGEDGDTVKTYFSEKIVGDDGVTLMSSFAGNFTADGKVDASSNAKKITLTGGDDSDTLIGGKGTNVLNGNAGDDILIGNGGADTFVYSSGDDTITDYESKDKISLTSAIADFTIDGDDVIINFDDGSLTISDAANSPVSFVETTNGRVTTNVNVFAENGIFNKLKTAVTLKADASSYTAPTNVISIDGGLATGDVEIVGNSKANKIYAGDNGSTLDGGSNNDSLWGGNGNDTFIYSGGKDVIYGFGDGDALNFSGDFTASVKSNAISFKVGSTANAVTLKDYSATTFNVNGETYAISNGSNFVKK